MDALIADKTAQNTAYSQEAAKLEADMAANQEHTFKRILQTGCSGLRVKTFLMKFEQNFAKSLNSKSIILSM